MPWTAQLLNADEVAGRFDRMIHDITRFGSPGLGHFLREWQADDMHRKHPFLTGPRRAWKGGRATAQTIARPHSRYEVEHSKVYQQRLGRRLRGKTKPRLIPAVKRLHWSTRPILREGLWKSAVELITKAFHKEVSWKKE